MTITRKELADGLVREDEVHFFTAFASDLEETCKGWPLAIQTTLGNGQDFMRISKKVQDGDLQWVAYRQALGCITLRIFNT